MENLIIKGKAGTYFVPNVILNANSGECEISGESYLEDSDKFYETIQEWVKKFVEEMKKPLKFHFRLTYFNTSSSRGIHALLKLLCKYQHKNMPVQVYWHYPIEDLDVREEGEDYLASTGIQMTLLSYRLFPS